MWAPGGMFRLPRLDLPPRIEQVPEPAHVQAFVAQLSVEAFHASNLCRLVWMNVNDVDLPLDGPRQEMRYRSFPSCLNASPQT